MSDEGSDAGRGTTGAPARPAWLDEYLSVQEGATYTVVVKLEPFVTWLDGADPAAVSAPNLVDLIGFWVGSLGVTRTRSTMGAVRDLYAWMRERDAYAAGALWTVADDYLEGRLSVQAPVADGDALLVAAPKADWAPARGGCAVMGAGAVVAIGGIVWGNIEASSTPGMFAGLLPLLCGFALATPLLLIGFILLIRGVRRVGALPPGQGWALRVGLGVASLLIGGCGLTGTVGMLRSSGSVLVLPFIVAALAGLVGIVTVVQSFGRPGS